MLEKIGKSAVAHCDKFKFSNGRVRLRPNQGFARHPDLQYDPHEFLARLVDQSY
jgi:hypothetical protein